MHEAVLAEAERKVETAMVGLLAQQPFFASILHTMELSVEDGLPAKTVIVDGERVFVHPRFAIEHRVDELRAVLAKEAMHIVYKHHLRRGSRDARRWNLAASYVVIPILLECGLHPPSGYLYDKDYANLSVEEVYDLLEDEDDEEELERQFARAMRTGGIVVDPEDPEKLGGEAGLELDAAIRFAMAQAAGVGKMPLGLKKRLDQGMERAVPWQELLRHSISREGAIDWSYSRPSLFAPPDVILPTVHGMQAGLIVIVGDTSGSLTVDDLRDQIAETNAIIEMARPSRVFLVQCDAQVQDVMELDGPLPDITVSGGGGTAFAPAFDWVEDEGLWPDCLIYMTDCDGPMPRDPGYPVIWLSTTSKKGSFGHTIHTKYPEYNS
jgi:predicted metal-dependent peptidase